MYLRKEDGKRLIQRITGRFPSGQLLFGCYGTLGIRLQKLGARGAQRRREAALGHR